MNKKITFTNLFDLKEIQKLQNAFAKATGVGTIITDPAGVAITKPSNFCRLCRDVIRKTEKGLNDCKAVAKMGHYKPDGPLVQPCLNGGLWDAVSSIRVRDKHIANWIIGQVRNEAYTEEEMMNFARDMGADEEEFRSALQEVTVMPLKQFKEVANAVFLMANQMSQMAFQNIRQKELSESLEQEIADRKRAEEEVRLAKKRMETWEKYIIFSLASVEYGISISRIQEVIGIMPVTPLPQMPYYMKGVINLRGKVIPVMDLRVKLGLNETDYTERTCIIIVKTEGVMASMLVDSVSGVLNIRGSDIEDAPAFGPGSDSDYIFGMTRDHEKIKILLDTDSIFNLEEISASKI